MKKLLPLLAIPLLASAGEIKPVTVNDTPMTGVENTYFSAAVSPLGGLIKSLVYKPGNFQITDSKYGTGTENCWNLKGSRFFLRDKPVSLTTENTGTEIRVNTSANHQGGDINFLKVNKSWRFPENEARVILDYDFENIESAMSPLNYGFWIHHVLGVMNSNAKYYYPTTRGISVHEPLKSGNETWKFQPSRGWLAAADDKGRGVALTMPYPYVRCLYSWFDGMNIPSMEYRMEQVSIKDGASFKTTCSILPFCGLTAVSGAGDAFVGQIDAPSATESGKPVVITVKLHSAKVCSALVNLQARLAPNGKWNRLAEKELNFDKPASVQQFSVKYTGDFDTLLEIEAVVTSAGKEACTLNAAINFDECEEQWNMEPREDKVTSESAKVDLLRFNNVWPFKRIPFAKSLPGGKMKTLMLVHYTNISEVTAFSTQLDMDFTAPYLFTTKGEPHWRLGDYFGFLGENDISANLDQALKKDYDCIVIGGVQWPYFSATQKNQILNKVKNGCGLIYISSKNALPDFPQEKPVQSPELFKAVPKAEIANLAVPFELFTPEQVWKHQAGNGKILATAGTFPWLTESKLGKGTVYFLNCNTLYGRFSDASGLAPDYECEYPDRTSPHEFYFLLLAKLMRNAGGRQETIQANADLSGINPVLDITSIEELDVQMELFLMDSFMEKRSSLRQPIQLKPGKNTLYSGLKLEPSVSPQSLWCIITNKAGQVLFSGAWALNKTPDASIASLTLPGKFARAEIPVNCTLNLQGNLEGKKILVEVWDSYDRKITEKILPAQNEIRTELSLDNQLPSRFARITAKLLDNGKSIHRKDAFLTVRPKDETLVWDDFEVGTWMSDDGARRYLWKEQAEMMRKNCFSSVIANTNRFALDFPVRYNLHPSILGDLGLGRAQEPPEYAKTGDKMLLVRKRCLSDPALLEKNRNALKHLAEVSDRNAIRFAWMGDEQSVTSYGGTPIDICFSKHCLKEFRIFLENKYGSLETLNKEWKTDFKSFDDVLPFTKDEVWGKCADNIAGWADHREFMDQRLENAITYQLQDFRKIAPQVYISMSGTQAPTAYGGMDWERMLHNFNSLLNYYVGGQEELQRSFLPEGKYSPWNLGYSYKPKVIAANVYRTLFTGSHGIYGFCYPTLVNPDWTLPPAMGDALPHLRTITAGLGKHWLNNLKVQTDVAILYSQASLRAAFFEKRKPLIGETFIKYNLLLRNCGIEFNYVTSTQLKNNCLDGYKYLILPDVTAMGDDEIAAIQDFAAKGGKIYAENMPATRKQNCVPRDYSPLAELFSKPGNVLKAELDFNYLDAYQFPEKPENQTILAKEQNALKKFTGKNQLRLQFNGQDIQNAECYQRRSNDGALYLGIVTPNTNQRKITVQFPEKGHVYNVISGRYLGETDSVETILFSDYPLLLAVLKNKRQTPSAEMQGNTLIINSPVKSDTVYAVEVISPYGESVNCYCKNLIAVNGMAEYKIPFALSDKKGSWNIKITEIVSKLKCTVTHELK